MKKIIALLLVLVMALSLSVVAFADGPLPLFDPELVGKDGGGMGRPLFVSLPTVKPAVIYGPDGQPIPRQTIVSGKRAYDSSLASAIAHFAADTAAGLLYGPAQNLAAVLQEKGAQIEVTVNSVTTDINKAATELQTETTSAIKGAQEAAHKIILIGKVVVSQSCVMGRNLLSDVNNLVHSKEIDSLCGNLDAWANDAIVNAGKANETVEMLCGELLGYVNKVVNPVISATEPSAAGDYTGTVAGEQLHKVIASAADWLTTRETFVPGGDLAHMILFGMAKLFREKN